MRQIILNGSVIPIQSNFTEGPQGCIDSYTCKKCGHRYQCYDGKPGTTVDNITYMWGPCLCGFPFNIMTKYGGYCEKCVHNRPPQEVQLRLFDDEV